MTVSLSVATAAPDDVDVIGVPVFSGLTLAGDGAAVDLDHLRARGFEARVGDTVTLPGDDGTIVVAVGVGAQRDVDAAVIRRASGALARAASKRTSLASYLLDAVADEDRPAAAQAAAEGTQLATYRFTRFKSDPKPATLASVALVTKGGKRVATAVERGIAVAEAVALARDLVNTPAGDLVPSVLAKTAVDVAERVGLTVEVIDEKQAKKLGLGGLVGVGQGSDNPPRLVKLTYEPAKPARTTLALVGKGITFDSGGLSIKPADGMMSMKNDMGGSAAVLAAMSVLPALAPATRVHGYLCIAENMVSGKAIRPGDVLTISNGTTVEVLNTDAEGRLVLADGLSMAVRDGADAIVDLATLTGACVVALGEKVAGRMGNHDGLGQQVQDAADRAGEAFWPLPLPKEYRRMLDSDVADLKNISGGRSGGALTAGLFLQEFVAGTPWVHLDIAGPVTTSEERGHEAKGATGFAVRTLVELVSTFRKPGR
jgi:leucyl aminopeptidase